MFLIGKKPLLLHFDFTQQHVLVFLGQEVVEGAVDFVNFLAHDLDAPFIGIEVRGVDFEDVGEVFGNGVDSAIDVHNEETFLGKFW